MRSQAPTFRPDIEGLRGLAVVLVVLFHVGVPGFSGGFVGVDVFFVLSGYLITGILVREIEETGSLRLGRFYARRVRRLLPAAALVVLVTLALAAVLLSPLVLERFSPSAVATSLYAANAWFAISAGDYFAPDVASDPFLHTWSLSVEEQFYLVWPFLLLLGFRRFRSRDSLLLFLAAVAAASFAGSLWLTAHRPVLAFYASPTRAWQFALGGIAALLPVAWLEAHRHRLRILGIVGGGAVVAAAVLLSERTAYPGSAALIPTVGTALALLPGATSLRETQRWITGAVLQGLGRLSYSWYLWHWPALVLAAALFPPLGILGRGLAALAALGAAKLAFDLVETPVRFHPALVASSARSLALGALLTLTGVGAGLVALRGSASLQADAVQRAYAAAASDGRQMYDDCEAANQSIEPLPCDFGDTAGVTAGDTAGVTPGDRTIVLFGDSHAGQWIPALETIALENGWRLRTFLKGGCPPQQVQVNLGSRPTPYRECDLWREAVHREIAELGPALVVVSAFQAHVVDERRTALERPFEEWEAGTRALAERINAAGAELVLIRDTPWMGLDVPVCLSKRARSPATSAQPCSVPRAEAVDDRVFRAETAALLGLPRSRALDLTDALCGPVLCEGELRGVVVYRDGDHMTGTFARSLAGRLAEGLRDVVDR